MRFLDLSLFLVLLGGTCLAQELDPDRRTASTTRFSVDYPPDSGWELRIEERAFFSEADPFDKPEENIAFRRDVHSTGDDSLDHQLDISVSRQWPGIDECLVRPQDARSQREAIRRMDKVFKNIEAGQSRMFVRDLRQCANTIKEYVELHFKHAQFLFRESAGLVGASDATVIDKGNTVLGNKTVYFVRFQTVYRATSQRHEIARYVYFPPTFGQQDLFYYEVFTSATCGSPESCIPLGDTKGASLAVLASIQPLTGKVPRPVSAEQLAVAEFFDAKLLPDDGARFESFGNAVSIDGDTILVATACYRACDKQESFAYVFEQATGASEWNQKQKLNATDPEAIRISIFAVALDGDTIATTGAYAAYVFARSSATDPWDQRFIPGVSGYDVAIDGNTLVIGAAFEDCGKSSTVCKGAVYVFERVASTAEWHQQAKLRSGDSPTQYLFGSSVAIDSDTIIVGATGITSESRWKGGSHEGNDSGAVYVFKRDRSTASWNQEYKLTPADPAIRDHFGESVALDNDVLVVGATGDGKWGGAGGSAYVFVRDDTTGLWRQHQKVSADVRNDSGLPNHFGDAVAIEGGTIIIGAPYESGLRKYSGSAYVFRRDSSTGAWTQFAKLKAPDAAGDDHFGKDVSINGRTVVIGAPDDDDNDQSSGSAYVFMLPNHTVEQN